MANLGPTQLPNSFKARGLGYRTLIRKNFEKGPDFRTGLFTIGSTDLWRDEMGEVYTEGDYGIRHDGETSRESSIKEGYQQDFTQYWFSNKFGFGKLFERFVMNDVKKNEQAATHLGNKAYRIVQKMPMSLLTYGAFADTNTYLTKLTETTVSSLLPDGKRFFSTAHPVSPDNSTTWSNVSATNAAFSEDSYDAARENLEGQQLDMEGEVMEMGMEGKCLYVPYSKLKTAKLILESSLRAGTADNDKNVYKDGGPLGDTEIKYIPSWLMDTTNYPDMWFIMDKQIAREHESLMVLNNQPLTTKSFVLDDTSVAYTEANFITTVGAVSGRGFYGSLGTDTGNYTA